MKDITQPYEILIENRDKKSFAIAMDWPGWCRSGKNESYAINELLSYAHRFARTAEIAGFEFIIPESPAQWMIIEEIPGNSTTDFGAPAMQFESDTRPHELGELDRNIRILNACWQSFDEAFVKAHGLELSKGPRGGGRNQDKIRMHLNESTINYLKALGWKSNQGIHATDPASDSVRSQVVQGLQAAADHELPDVGPRGRQYWPIRFFVRRLAWHILDHAWEIEDRIIN